MLVIKGGLKNIRRKKIIFKILTFEGFLPECSHSSHSAKCGQSSSAWMTKGWSVD